MPTKRKITTPVKKTKVVAKSNAEPAEDLMDFEQFVSRKSPTSKKKTWLVVTLVVLIVLLSGAVYSLSQSSLQKDFKYQAVFLDNGQVYFAKVVKEDSLSVYLEDVYYIQTESQIVPSQEEGVEDRVVEVPVLIQRGSELHQPSGRMQLNREKIISIEEIGDDSEILAEIQRQESL
jgi:hypothetical protein